MIAASPDMPVASPALRLLLVIDSLDIGGAERHLVGLAAALVREGHQVTIACSIAGPLAPLAEQAGVTVRVLRNRSVKRRVDLGLAQRLAALVRHQRFDVINTHMYASSVAAAIATSGTRVPLVVTEQSQVTWRGRCARWWSRLVYRRAAHLIAVSEAIQQRLITTDGVPATRITV